MKNYINKLGKNPFVAAVVYVLFLLALVAGTALFIRLLGAP